MFDEFVETVLSFLLYAIICLAMLVLVSISSGCGGRALVAADASRAAACVQVETRCVDGYENGRLTYDAARACVDCARSTCDAIHTAIVNRAEGADNE